jgi:predicted Zn-dependent protease
MFGPGITRTALRLGVAALLAVFCAGGVRAADTKHQLAPLKAEADRVWQMNERGNVIEAAKEGALIVRVADALRDAGLLDEAKEYYRRAGLVCPWDFDLKLRQAELLKRLGDSAGASVLARQVLKYAETDRQLDLACQIAGMPATTATLPALADIQPAAGETVIGLVATPETDRWLLDATGKRLAAALGVRVGIAATDFAVGERGRNGRAQIARELRKSLPWDDPRLLMSAPDGRRIREEDLTDDQVIQAMEMFLKRDGQPGQMEAFKQRLVAADKVSQWDVTLLLGKLRAEKPQPAQGRVVYLALVPVDLYAGRASHLYGTADVAGNYAVVSYHRFAASATGEPPQSARLVARTLKQLLSSTGFALNVSRCSDPGCARAYPRSLVEHDAKGIDLCDECRAGFAKVLGHEVPAAREE